jgi:iron complex outermembrane receptor protein
MHQPLKGLFLTEGIRLDWDQSYQWSLVPQLNVAYILNNTTFRGSIGKGIRDADFTERYNNYNKTLVTSGRIGNPNINAEKSMNMEMGIDLFTEKSVQVHSTVFRRNQADMIDWVLTKFENMPRQSNLIATGSYALASNVASVNTTGIELDINGAHRMGSKINLRWNSGLTWVNAVAADDISSIYLSNYANIVWNSNFQLSHERGMISISTLFKNRAEQKTNSLAVGVTKSFALVNARADVYMWKRRGTLYMQAENLFNVAYADFLGARMPGRWLMVGVRVEVENKKRN